MTWREALEIVIAHTGVVRFRWLCSDANPQGGPHGCDAYRAWVIEQAGSLAPPVPIRPVTPTGSIAVRQPCGGCPGNPYEHLI